MNIHNQIADLRGTIEAIMAAYPEIAEDEVLRADMLEGATDFNEVMNHILNELDYCTIMQTGIAARVTELNARKSRSERHEEALRALMLSLMNKAELNKLVLPEATLSVGYRKPAPMVIDERLVPDEMCKFTRKPDMEKIRSAHADGGALPPGVTMSNGKTFLTVRSK